MTAGFSASSAARVLEKGRVGRGRGGGGGGAEAENAAQERAMMLTAPAAQAVPVNTRRMHSLRPDAGELRGMERRRCTDNSARLRSVLNARCMKEGDLSRGVREESARWFRALPILRAVH